MYSSKKGVIWEKAQKYLSGEEIPEMSNIINRLECLDHCLLRQRDPIAGEILKRVSSIVYPIVAEVGVYRGMLSWSILSRNPNLTLYLVDSWCMSNRGEYLDTGDPVALLSQECHDENYKATIENVKKFYSRVIVIKEFSSRAVCKIKDKLFDMVYIDADHSYSAVKEDLELWYPKVKDYGYIGGHDYVKVQNYGVIKAVNEFIEKKGLKIELGDCFTWFAKKSDN